MQSDIGGTLYERAGIVKNALAGGGGGESGRRP